MAVFRALQLGDMLCAVPAVRALRAALPQAEIVLVGLPWARAFVERFHAYLDGFQEFPGYPGLPERPAQLARVPGFLAAMQSERFDLALQLHGSGAIVNPLVQLFGARQSAGFFVPGSYCPDPARYLPYPQRGSETRRLLRLTEFLGIPTQGEHLEFPLDDDDRRALQHVAAMEGVASGSYVCLHPGARSAARRWPAERFAAVGDALAARGLRVVLTGATAEAELTRFVARAMHAPAIDLAGRTSLGALGALFLGARLLVCNDTGVSHVAAALRVPSVVIFSASEPERWAPRDSARHRVLFEDVACRPCAYETCPIGHPCALGVDVDAVLAQAEDLLRPAARREERRAYVA